MIDLHSHTHLSDGALAPVELLRRAIDNGLSHLAITDHDCTSALDELVKLPEAARLSLIPGVEVSTLWAQREIHIIGLFVDTNNEALSDLLHHHQGLRAERVEGFDQRLRAIGINGLMDYIQALPCIALSRNHVADFLIEQGHAADKQKAFSKFLGSSGRVRTPARWCTIDTAVAAIRGAGGIAVLAHPDRYKLTRSRLLTLLGEFRECGGEAMEVSYSNLSHEQLLSMAGLCRSLDLWASQGSDFHTPAAGWMDLGRIRQLPADVRERALWHHPRWAAPRPAAQPASAAG